MPGHEVRGNLRGCFCIVRLVAWLFLTHGLLACSSPPGSDTDVSQVPNALCESVTLAASPPSPQSVGASVSLAASASCSTGSPEYRFQVRAGSGPYTELRAWSPDP